jgi:predicted phosphodiesterase
MALMAIISDVHANSFALRAVLADAESRGASEVYCLGDVVGYNAQPRETLELLRQAKIPTVRGNHDMMACGELSTDRCGPNARASQRWTSEVLSDDDVRYLRSLDTQLSIDGEIILLHSRLDDPVSYLSSDEDYLLERERVINWQRSARVCFTGHTHIQRVIEISADGQLRRLTGAFVKLDPRCFYFVNPGSVGHPRASDYRASYALFDRDAGTIRLRRVRYDKARMLEVNRWAGIATDLGRGVLEYKLVRYSQRLRGVAGTVLRAAAPARARGQAAERRTSTLLEALRRAVR